MDCDDALFRVYEYLDGELTVWRRRAIARHLDDVSGLTATNVTVATVACCQTGSDTYAGPVPD